MKTINHVYLIFHKSMFRVNLDTLSAENPEQLIEKLVEFREQDLPQGMGFFVMDSKLYAVGGELIDKCLDFMYPQYGGSELEELSQYVVGLNHHVLVFDQFSKSVPFKVDNKIPPMRAPKFNARVSVIDGKVYVLSETPICFGSRFPSPRFECFDPIENAWEELPDPSFYGDELGNYFENFSEFVMDRTIYIASPRLADEMYNVDVGEWEKKDITLFCGAPSPFYMGGSFAKGDDDLVIGWTEVGLVAYVGIEGRHEILKDLTDVFFPLDKKLIYYNTAGYIQPLGEGKFCFVLSSYYREAGRLWSVDIGIFQVKTRLGIENQEEGLVNAVLLHYHAYDGSIFGTGDISHPRYVLVMSGEPSKKHGSAIENVEPDGCSK